jgi:hypothetical protein
MTQLRRDAAYIRTSRHERTTDGRGTEFDAFDEEVCKVLGSAHTVTSAAKTLSSTLRPDSRTDSPADLEDRVAASMLRLLQAERIQLSPDS